MILAELKCVKMEKLL